MSDQIDDRKDALAALPPSVATLYRATISFGTTEAQLVWQRYTAFLVLNGFFVTGLLSKWQDPYGSPLVVIGVLGLFVNGIWHALNFSGWRNQNLWYMLAANLPGISTESGLPTDFFREIWKLPCGWIYWLAQSIPTIFSIGAAACLGKGLHRVGLESCVALCVGLLALLAFALAAFLIEYLGIAKWKSHVAV